MLSSSFWRRPRREAERKDARRLQISGAILSGATALGACADTAAEPPRQVAPASVGASSSTTAPGSRSSVTGTTSESRSGAASARIVNINSASTEELNSLPDVGAERARRIIDNRPYRRTEELLERGILPKSVYDQINERLIAR